MVAVSQGWGWSHLKVSSLPGLVVDTGCWLSARILTWSLAWLPGLPGSMVAGFQEEQVAALSFIAQRQKADNMPVAVVTAPLRFKGRDYRCYHHPSSPVEGMSMSYHEKSVWDRRSCRELSNLPQCPALSEVSSDRSHLLLSALPPGSQRPWSLHLPHSR